MAVQCFSFFQTLDKSPELSIFYCGGSDYTQSRTAKGGSAYGEYGESIARTRNADL